MLSFPEITGMFSASTASLTPMASLTNPASYYNKLKVVINDGGNPNDTLYAMAVSTDNFASDTRYVQNDQTVGETLGSEDWQTYSSWGGADGVNIIGLDSSTTYYIKAAAKQGNYTETGFGPVSSASTSSPTISFDIDISASDTETDPPFAIDFGSLLSETITESPEKVWVDFATNGESGGKVYVYGQNGGLFSENRGYTITSATGDLSTLAEGFGAQGVTITQGSGGPFSVNSPYNVSGNNIGVTNSTIREIFGSGNPIGGGRASFLLKAKSGSTTPSAGDYTETLTVIASASY